MCLFVCALHLALLMSRIYSHSQIYGKFNVFNVETTVIYMTWTTPLQLRTGRIIEQWPKRKGNDTNLELLVQNEPICVLYPYMQQSSTDAAAHTTQTTYETRALSVYVVHDALWDTLERITTSHARNSKRNTNTRCYIWGPFQNHLIEMYLFVNATIFLRHFSLSFFLSFSSISRSLSLVLYISPSVSHPSLSFPILCPH